jgi:hypothetical protein
VSEYKQKPSYFCEELNVYNRLYDVFCSTKDSRVLDIIHFYKATSLDHALSILVFIYSYNY